MVQLHNKTYSFVNGDLKAVSATDEDAKESVEKANPESAKEDGKESVKKANPESAKEDGKESVEKANPESAKEDGKESVEKANPESAKEDGKESVGASSIDAENAYSAKSLEEVINPNTSLKEQNKTTTETGKSVAIIKDPINPTMEIGLSLCRCNEQDKKYDEKLLDEVQKKISSVKTKDEKSHEINEDYKKLMKRLIVDDIPYNMFCLEHNSNLNPEALTNTLKTIAESEQDIFLAYFTSIKDYIAIEKTCNIASSEQNYAKKLDDTQNNHTPSNSEEILAESKNLTADPQNNKADNGQLAQKQDSKAKEPKLPKTDPSYTKETDDSSASKQGKNRIISIVEYCFKIFASMQKMFNATLLPMFAITEGNELLLYREITKDKAEELADTPQLLKSTVTIDPDKAEELADTPQLLKSTVTIDPDKAEELADTPQLLKSTVTIDPDKAEELADTPQLLKSTVTIDPDKAEELADTPQLLKSTVTIDPDKAEELADTPQLLKSTVTIDPDKAEELAEYWLATFKNLYFGDTLVNFTTCCASGHSLIIFDTVGQFINLLIVIRDTLDKDNFKNASCIVKASKMFIEEFNRLHSELNSKIRILKNKPKSLENYSKELLKFYKIMDTDKENSLEIKNIKDLTENSVKMINELIELMRNAKETVSHIIEATQRIITSKKSKLSLETAIQNIQAANDKLNGKLQQIETLLENLVYALCRLRLLDNFISLQDTLKLLLQQCNLYEDILNAITDWGTVEQQAIDVYKQNQQLFKKYHKEFSDILDKLKTPNIAKDEKNFKDQEKSMRDIAYDATRLQITASLLIKPPTLPESKEAIYYPLEDLLPTTRKVNATKAQHRMADQWNTLSKNFFNLETNGEETWKSLISFVHNKLTIEKNDLDLRSVVVTPQEQKKLLQEDSWQKIFKASKHLMPKSFVPEKNLFELAAQYKYKEEEIVLAEEVWEKVQNFLTRLPSLNLETLGSLIPAENLETLGSLIPAENLETLGSLIPAENLETLGSLIPAENLETLGSLIPAENLETLGPPIPAKNATKDPKSLGKKKRKKAPRAPASDTPKLNTEIAEIETSSVKSPIDLAASQLTTTQHLQKDSADAAVEGRRENNASLDKNFVLDIDEKLLKPPIPAEKATKDPQFLEESREEKAPEASASDTPKLNTEIAEIETSSVKSPIDLAASQLTTTQHLQKDSADEEEGNIFFHEGPIFQKAGLIPTLKKIGNNVKRRFLSMTNKTTKDGNKEEKAPGASASDTPKLKAKIAETETTKKQKLCTCHTKKTADEENIKKILAETLESTSQITTKDGKCYTVSKEHTEILKDVFWLDYNKDCKVHSNENQWTELLDKMGKEEKDLFSAYIEFAEDTLQKITGNAEASKKDYTENFYERQDDGKKETSDPNSCVNLTSTALQTVTYSKQPEDYENHGLDDVGEEKLPDAVGIA